MKNLFKSLAFVALATATFTACNEDACKDIECGEFGTCNEGVCLCESYYELGADNKCSVLERAKFLGSYNVSESCQFSTADYTSNINTNNTTANNEVRISNVWDSFNNAVVGTVAGNTITIARQTPDNDSYYIQGSGVLEGSTVVFTVTITDESDATAILTNNCTFTYAK